MILASVKWQIYIVYLEDDIIFSCSPEEHLKNLDEVLKHPGKTRVTVKTPMCHFFHENVEYLPLVLGRGRVRVLEKRLREQRGLRCPETQEQRKSCLGTRGVYRRFVADFAKIVKPVTALTSTKLSKVLPFPMEKEKKALDYLRGQL